MIKFMIAGSGNDAGYTLSDHGSHGSSGNSHFRNTEKTKDQDRVKDDVGDSSAQLGSHAENCFSRGCEQTLKEKLSKQTKRDIITVLRYSIPNLRISGSALCTWLA